MIALSAGGRSAAIWSAVNPPHESPIMPTDPVAPGLGGNPRDRLDAVLPLLPGVLVLEQPRRVAGATEIHSQAGVPVLGEVAVHRLVAHAAQVAAPVRDVLQNRAHGSLLGMGGKPDARGQPFPVRQGNPRGLYLDHLRR